MAHHAKKFVSQNPFSNQVIKEFDFTSAAETQKRIDETYDGYMINRSLSIKDRAAKLIRLASQIESDHKKYAELITLEMGKPITQSIAEVKKSAQQCRFFAENADKFLRSDRIKAEVDMSYIQYDPIGPIFQIVPFNFPFWLCFKGAVPALIAGNSILHRNSANTPLVGLALEEAFKSAGFDSGEFISIMSSTDDSEKIISNPKIRGCVFTGSSSGGSVVAQLAGKYLKKTVMELGGSDPFLVLADANVQQAVTLAVASRVLNAGQVCIAGKRFIIHESIYDEFRDKLIKAMGDIKLGDPLLESTTMGPLCRADLVENLQRQVDESIKQGARLLCGGKQPEDAALSKGHFFLPTLLESDKHDNIAFKEELFGPVWALIKYKTEEEGIRLANDTEYGLGAVIVTSDVKRAEHDLVWKIDAGSVFINEVVKSDPRFPSGGVKLSGYGKECGETGLREFVNAKTVWSSKPKS